MSIWDERYAGEDYLFGIEPNAFLASQKERLKPGMYCLAVADGEGRNGVWLSEQGLEVLSVDSSPVGLEKARRLAAQREVSMRIEQVDLFGWSWPEERFDIVAGIFIQFAPPGERERMFEGMRRSLKPGGLLLVQGYTPKQLEYKTGGPSQVENLYTEAMLRELCAGMEILHLAEHESNLTEGNGHCGRSALIDLVACKS